MLHSEHYRAAKRRYEEGSGPVNRCLGGFPHSSGRFIAIGVAIESAVAGSEDYASWDDLTPTEGLGVFDRLIGAAQRVEGETLDGPAFGAEARELLVDQP